MARHEEMLARTIAARIGGSVRRICRIGAGVGVIVGLGSVLAAGCFHPREVPCAFSCVSPGARCPTEFTCGADGLCHRDGVDGCTLTPPDGGAGGAPGASPDAGADSAPVDASASDVAADPDVGAGAPG